jgi:FeS assembly SUF system regulator
MVRLGKLTDYGMVLMTYMARSQNPLRTARDLAAESKLPVSTVSKLLKELLHSGLLVSHRGIKGGYLLARLPQEISVLEIIAAFEGSVALTECTTEIAGLCELESSCPMKNNQRVINEVVRGVLGTIMLSDLIQPLQLASTKDLASKLVPRIHSVPGGMQ